MEQAREVLDRTVWQMLLLAPVAMAIMLMLVWVVTQSPPEFIIYILISSVVLLLILMPAAIGILVCAWARGWAIRTLSDMALYALVAAGVPAAIMTLLDWGEDYFSRPGVSGFLTVFGMTVGAVYGATVGLVARTRHQRG